MSYLKAYTKQKNNIKSAKNWVKHFTARGRDNASCVIHAVGANPQLMLQYTEGGENYWQASKSAGEEFVRALNKVIEKDLHQLCQVAIKEMEKDLSIKEEEAKREYKCLFDEDMG